MWRNCQYLPHCTWPFGETFTSTAGSKMCTATSKCWLQVAHLMLRQAGMKRQAFIYINLTEGNKEKRSIQRRPEEPANTHTHTLRCFSFFSPTSPPSFNITILHQTGLTVAPCRWQLPVGSESSSLLYIISLVLWWMWSPLSVWRCVLSEQNNYITVSVNDHPRGPRSPWPSGEHRSCSGQLPLRCSSGGDNLPVSSLSLPRMSTDASFCVPAVCIPAELSAIAHLAVFCVADFSTPSHAKRTAYAFYSCITVVGLWPTSVTFVAQSAELCENSLDHW